MAKKSYKLNNENKLNNKNEVQSKSDSVVLTNYKKLEDNFFIEEQNQKVNSEGYFGSIAYTLSKKDEMIKNLENLRQFRVQLEDGQKYLLENYTKLMPLQEVEKKEFEELIKEFEQFRVQLEDGQKYLLEMYTELAIISEVEKRELEKVNNLTNSTTSSRLGYENLDLMGLKESWQKLNEKFEQFRNEFENTKELQEKLEKENKIKDNWIAQIHDELIFEINKSNLKLEKYTKLQKDKKNEFEKVNNLKNSTTSSRLGYENLDLMGLKELNEKFDQYRVYLENKLEDVSEMYANLEKLQEADKKQLSIKELQEKLEKENKILEQLRVHLENKLKHVSEMYANLEKLQEAKKKEYRDYSISSQSDSYEEEHDSHFLVETSYNYGIPSLSSQVIYDNQYVKELNSAIGKKEFELDSSNEKELGKDNKDYSLFKVGNYKNESLNSPQYFFYDSLEYDNFDLDDPNIKESEEELEI